MDPFGKIKMSNTHGSFGSSFAKLCVKLSHVMTMVSVFLVLILSVPITYEAIVRSLKHPTIWAFEVTTYLLIAAGFLANPVSARSGAHFRVTMLRKAFPKFTRALDTLAHGATLLFALILTGTGSYLVLYSWSNHIGSGTLLGTPLWIPQLSLPLGGLGLSLQTLAFLLTGEGPDEEPDAFGD